MATRLQLSQSERLKFILDRINQYDMRFPVAQIAEDLKVDAGNLSNMLKGKKPISDNFYTSFNLKYPDKNVSNNKATVVRIPINKQEQIIEELQKQVVRLEARINVLTITLVEVTAAVKKKEAALVDAELTQAIDLAAERLLNELHKKFS